MSDVLTGDPSNVTSPLAATVTALTNNGSGEIRVTTAAPHLYGPNDTVLMNCGPVQGDFVITVIDSTHFDLQGSTYTASYTGSVADQSLTPQILVPTDGDTFSAQLSGLTSAFQGVLDRTQRLQAGIIEAAQVLFNGSASDANTWSAPVMPDPSQTYLVGVGFGGPEWDAVNNLWMQPAVAGSSDAQIYISYDGLDEVWNTTGAPLSTGFAPTTCSVGKDPGDSTTYYLGFCYPGGLAVYSGVAGVWNPVLLDATTVYQDVQFGAIGGYIMVWTGGTVAGVTNVVVSNNQFGSHVSTNIGATVGAVGEWVVRSNGSILIAAPMDQTFAAPFIYTSVDGHTLVAHTATFGGNLLATDAIVGLDYGTINGVGTWVMAVRTVGGQGKLLRSTDGINWTLGQTLTDLVNVHSLAAVGNLWVAILKATAPAEPQIVYSTDTVSWYQTPARLQQFVTHVSLVRSNGIQFCASNRYGARFSQVLQALAPLS